MQLWLVVTVVLNFVCIDVCKSRKQKYEIKVWVTPKCNQKSSEALWDCLTQFPLYTAVAGLGGLKALPPARMGSVLTDKQ